MSNKTSDKNVASEEEKLMKSLEYELDKIIEKSSKVETATEIVYLRQPITLMFLKLLKELEQKDKRIQELEEENAMLKKTNNIAKNVNIEDITEVMNKSYEEFMSNYINKQVVIELIENETIDISGFECIAVEDLQELLEGGENEKSN